MTTLPGLLRHAVRAVVPTAARRTARSGLEYTRGIGARMLMGRNVEPLSYLWGSDRGLPIHRYYLQQFLEEFRGDIRGHCLEFFDDAYGHRYGGSAVGKLDILHMDDSNPEATIVADLTAPNEVPSDTFECIICTHVLHLIVEVDKAVADLWRILKPGGVLLAAVPHISMCDPGWHEVWRFTPEGLTALLGRKFDAQQMTVRAYGNSLTAAGELRGLVTSEFHRATLDYHDPRFALEVCARARKTAGGTP